ncbi:MAG TPA: YhjD/YihY/BrkB family envelope integrity protein [Gammaproteobacteria bacterium]|nr:YhjD/YihY/BrkB family envelope integrity protein [Gammaproteobacteria bacterium]
MLTRLKEWFAREVWHQDVHKMTRSRRILVFWVRMFNVLFQDVQQGDLNLRAMSLVYTSILSLVPLLAFAFAVLKGFGVQNKMEPMLLNFFAPLGPKAGQFAGQVIDFVNNVKAGVLGILGLLLLLYTVISLVRKVEAAFNHLWRVREPRTFVEGFGHYLSVIMIGPLLFVAALGMTATVSSHTAVDHIVGWAPAGALIVALAKLLPYVLVIAAFTFIYMFVPHTYVQFKAALAGAAAAGIAWELSGWVFATLVVTSTRLAAIYSGFAILVMFMIWLYVSWLIVLMGSQVAFYIQNPELVRHGLRRNEVGSRTMERVALHVMYLVGRAYQEHHTPWSREQLARRLHLPTDIVLDVIERLRKRGLLMVVTGRIRRYIPATDMSNTTLKEIVLAVRQNPLDAGDADRHIKSIPQVDGVVHALDRAVELAVGNRTLRDLVNEGEMEDLDTKTILRVR